MMLEENEGLKTVCHCYSSYDPANSSVNLSTTGTCINLRPEHCKLQFDAPCSGPDKMCTFQGPEISRSSLLKEMCDFEILYLYEIKSKK